MTDLATENAALRKALYELVHNSFPPVGADVPDLVEQHHKAVRKACALLGIDPRPIERKEG